jgi:hypothetical protein
MSISLIPSRLMSKPPATENPALSPATAPNILNPALPEVKEANSMLGNAVALVCPKITYAVPAPVRDGGLER